MSLCQVGECTRPGVRYLKDGVTRACWGHLKREKRGKPVSVQLKDPQGGRRPRRAPSKRLAAAALRYSDADPADDDEFQRSWENLMDAAHEFVLHARRGAREVRAAQKTASEALAAIDKR